MTRRPDLLCDPIPRLLLGIAAPASIGFFFNTMFNVVDTYWAGQISTNALAALGLSFPVFLVMLAVGIGLSSGSSALIANSLGARRIDAARNFLAQSFSFGLIAAAVFGVPLYFALPWIFSLFTQDPALSATALAYTRVIVAGSPFFIMNNILNAGLTARGDTRAFRNFLISGFFMNVLLDPVFMFGIQINGNSFFPALGVAGTALATIVIQAAGVLYLGFRLGKSGALKDIRLRDLRPEPKQFRDLASQGIPSSVNFLTMAGGTFVINFFVSRYGADAVAAYGTATRVEQIALIPTIGLNIALAAIVGQNNGAGRPERVRLGYKAAMLSGLGIMLLILTPVLIFAPRLLRLFTGNTEVIRIGLLYLYIQALTFYSYVVMNLSNAVLQGLRRPSAIMWVGLTRQLILPPLVFPLLANVFGLGVSGVFWGIVLVNWSAAIATFLHAQRILRESGGMRQSGASGSEDLSYKTEAAPVFGCIEPEDLETV